MNITVAGEGAAWFQFLGPHSLHFAMTLLGLFSKGLLVIVFGT